MPKIVDHEAYRRELLESSFGLFAEKGYQAVTMRGLARALDVSTGTLYHYFATKEDLFEQMVRQVASRTVLDAVSAMPPDASPGERVEVLLGFLEAVEPQLQQFISVIIEYRRHSHSEQQARVAREALDEYEQALATHLAVEGAGRAQAVLSAVIGVLTYRMIDPNPPPFSRSARSLRAILLQQADAA